jgi:secondary thiamine-phosphate synthase enzyme
MRTAELTVHTGGRRGLFDITPDCERFVAGGGDGLLNIFVPHATAGVVIMELGAGSDDDLLAALERLLPHDDRWRHRHGTSGHGADHVLPLLVPPSITVPVRDGRLALGTWQSIAVVDTNVDNRTRTVQLSFLGDERA